MSTKLKAVGYNRVSTDELVQIDALQVQIKETQECIERMGWTMVDQYIDEGKTGTVSNNRDEYQRLYRDLETDKFDIVVIKSQDRLMRNTKDWYIFIDALVTNNKRLFIYLENKFYTPDDALITGIKAILAEEFSRDMSRKQNNAHKRRQQLGTSAVITSATWGYDNINKEIVINKSEAEVVKTIFDLCLQGYGSRSISKELANRGIYSRTGKQFADVTVRKIIRNPLFMGTIVMNKTHKDFNTKRTIKNPPEEWIYHDNMIPSIVSKDIWEKANSLMDKRSQECKADEVSKRRIGLNIGKFDLSGKVVCGMCGFNYWRRSRATKSKRVIEWSCSEYIRSGRKTKQDNDTRGNNKKVLNNRGCDNRHIKDEHLINLIDEVSKDVFENKKDCIVEQAMSIIKEVLNSNNSIEIRDELIDNKTRYINQKNILMDKLLDGIITDTDFKRRNSDIDIKLSEIENKLNDIEDDYTSISDTNSRLNDIRQALESKELLTQEARTHKLIQHINKIVVYEDYIEIYFDFLKAIRITDNSTDNEKYQFVDSGIYLISQTETYHHKSNYTYKVNLYV